MNAVPTTTVPTTPATTAAKAPAETPTHLSDTPARPEAEQLAFFDAAMAKTEAAERVAQLFEVTLDLAGTRVLVRFSGERLRDAFLPAISHLVEAPEGEPEAVFHVWDTVGTGVTMSPPPCPHDCFTHRGDIWGMSSSRIKSAFHWHEFSVNLFDHARNTGIFWIYDAENLPYWSKASPMRTLFHWWLSANGAYLLHAAAVGTADGGLLLAGRGGTGKSTTALASLESGMRYVSDDYLAVRLDPEPTAFSLYATAKVNPPQIGRFPGLAAHAVALDVPEGEKVVVQLYPDFSDRVVRKLPLRALASPVFGDTAESRFVPDDGSSTRRSAAFTTLSQLPHAGRDLHEFIDRLMNSLPTFRLQLGHEVPRVPDAIREHLALDDRTLRELATPVVPTKDAAETLPVVSVVIPVFNGAKMIRSAVQSVLAQSWGALEIVVVDDGSSDNIAEAVEQLPVDVLFVKQVNAGPASARNRGIAEASGELVAFLDVDDLWTPEHLRALYAQLRDDPTADVAHGLAQLTTLVSPDQPGDYLGNPGEAFPYYIGAGLYRKRAFEQIGVFDAMLRFSEDTEWFQRARDLGVRVVSVPEVTLFVRRHAGNSTRGKSFTELNALRVLKKHLDRQRAKTSAT